jgi:WD40 repeat protein
MKRLSYLGIVLIVAAISPTLYACQAVPPQILMENPAVSDNVTSIPEMEMAQVATTVATPTVIDVDHEATRAVEAELLERHLAEQAARFAQAAQAKLAGDPELALLLATAGFCLSSQPDTHRQLVETVQTFYHFIDRPEELAVLHGHVDEIATAVFAPDGQTILTAGSDEMFRLWDREGRQEAHFNGRVLSVFSPVSSAVFSADGQMILTASGDRTARLWDRQGEQLAVFAGHEDMVVTAVFSPDDQAILTASFDGTARLWNRQGEQLAIVASHRTRDPYQSWLWSAVFSPDGQSILTAGSDQTARLWDREGNETAVLRGHVWWVRSANFSPDGQTIVTAGYDGTIRLWDRQGRPLTVWQGHEESAWSALFSPDGELILTTGTDQTARLWDRQGNPLAVWRGHSDWVVTAVFSPDKQTILTASVDRTARLWPSYTPSFLAQETSRLIQRGFTEAECQQFFPDEPGACPRTLTQFRAFVSRHHCATAP